MIKNKELFSNESLRTDMNINTCFHTLQPQFTCTEKMLMLHNYFKYLIQAHTERHICS